VGLLDRGLLRHEVINFCEDAVAGRGRGPDHEVAGHADLRVLEQGLGGRLAGLVGLRLGLFFLLVGLVLVVVVAEEVERAGGDLARGVGLGAGEVRGERLLADEVEALAAVVGGVVLGDEDGDRLEVGADADRLDRDVARGEVLGDGQLEGELLVADLAVVEDLDRALAERAAADEHGAPEVAQRAGDDLGGAGRALVDDHDQRHVGEVVAVVGGELLAGRRAADGRDDRAGLDEGVGDLDGGGEQAAGVVAHVEHDAADAGLLEVGELGPQLLAGRLGEVAVDLHEPDLDRLPVLVGARQDLALHAVEGDHVAGDRVLPGLVAALALDVQRDGGAGLAAHVVDGLRQAHRHRRLAVDLDDAVARLEAGLRRGVAVDHADHGDLRVAHADLDAEPAEAALRAGLHLVEVVGAQQVGVRVERAEHALDDRVLGVALLVVGQGGVAVDEAEHLADVGADGPQRLDVADRELLLGGADAHAHPLRLRTGAAEGLDQDLRDRLLEALEPRHGHAVGVDALGLDVVLGDVPQRPVEDPQVGRVVGRGDPPRTPRLALLGLRRGVLQSREAERQRQGAEHDRRGGGAGVRRARRRLSGHLASITAAAFQGHKGSVCSRFGRGCRA
jgi:hypothetical protein